MAGLLRIILFALLGYYVYKLIRPLFIRQAENTHVKGSTGPTENVQRKHKDKIEDAEFEEID
jgi:hypothetical protein